MRKWYPHLGQVHWFRSSSFWMRISRQPSHFVNTPAATSRLACDLMPECSRLSQDIEASLSRLGAAALVACAGALVAGKIAQHDERVLGRVPIVTPPHHDLAKAVRAV